nr:hypothetical protein [uncultured Flavobacterium sp.]
MKSKKRYYRYLNYQACYEYLYAEPKFCEALAYLLTFEKMYDFKVIPHVSSIEISNETITIFIVLMGSFQFDKYDEVKNQKNVHFVSFDRNIEERHEFFIMKNEIKLISIGMLMETVVALSQDGLINKMENFKEVGF